MNTLLEPTLRRSALTFAGRLRALSDDYVGRADTIRTVALATLCREHVLLIGPPGTAKSALLERFGKMVNSRYFSYLLTRFTEPAELFGAIDVSRFQAGTYHVNTEGMLPTAEMAFLDEVFHGSSAILNTLLTLINERRYHNGPVAEPSPLCTLLGATNEMPDDSLLLAFCDRFLFRSRLDYVPDDAVSDILSVGWEAERKLIREGPGAAGSDSASFPMEELVLLQRALADVDLSGVVNDLTKILLTFREEAVMFSDRRAVKAQKAIAASAVLAGRARADLTDLAVLAELWTSPYDEATIRRIIDAHGVPLIAPDRESRSLEEIHFLLRRLADDGAEAGSREECREVLRRLGRLLAEVRSGYPNAAEALRGIQTAQTQVLVRLRDRFGENGEFDV